MTSISNAAEEAAIPIRHEQRIDGFDRLSRMRLLVHSELRDKGSFVEMLRGEAIWETHPRGAFPCLSRRPSHLAITPAASFCLALTRRLSSSRSSPASLAVVMAEGQPIARMTAFC